MSRRLTIAAVAGLLVAVAWHAPTSADESDVGAASDPDAGNVEATASQEFDGGAGASGASVSRPSCRWEKFTMAMSGIPGAGDGPVIRQPDGSLVTTPSETTVTLYRKYCPGHGPEYVWVSDGVRAEDLIASASQRVSAQLPSPSVNMSPDPAVGGIVNIGLWMAVEDPGQVSITASVGPVWATVTARYERTVWEMGNGDVVDCAGVGTPISDLDTVEQGPCGYTYRWPSAPKFTVAGLAYQASVTGHWVITYATSSGGSGSLAPIARSSGFDYQVREIQTVRVAADG